MSSPLFWILFLIAIIPVSILLSGCDDSHERAYPERDVLPPELQGCTFHFVRIKGTSFRVVRCKGEDIVTETHSYGKGQLSTTVTINGKKYVEVPEEQKGR